MKIIYRHLPGGGFIRYFRGEDGVARDEHGTPIDLDRPKRSDLASPRLNLDTMDGVQSMLDGKMYTSKAALRQTYKDAGVTEVGNDSSITDPKYAPAKAKVDKAQVRDSVDKALSQAGFGS